jgi:hypothetical protein
MLITNVEENSLAPKYVSNTCEFSRTATSLIAVMIITHLISGITVYLSENY